MVMRQCGWTALMRAINNRHPDMAAMLVDAGADIHLRDKVRLSCHRRRDAAAASWSRIVVVIDVVVVTVWKHGLDPGSSRWMHGRSETADGSRR